MWTLGLILLLLGMGAVLATLLLTRWGIIDLGPMMVGLVVSGAVLGSGIGVLL
jgi:hypothetical protein